MPDVPCLHEHVAYLLVRAPRAREVGDFGLFEYFVAMAVRCDDAANEIGRGHAANRRVASALTLELSAWRPDGCG
jgi:hypothetical protein